jgi:hypothetical protein
MMAAGPKTRARSSGKMAAWRRFRNRLRAVAPEKRVFPPHDEFAKKFAQALLQCPGLCGI